MRSSVLQGYLGVWISVHRGIETSNDARFYFLQRSEWRAKSFVRVFNVKSRRSWLDSILTISGDLRFTSDLLSLNGVNRDSSPHHNMIDWRFILPIKDVGWGMHNELAWRRELLGSLKGVVIWSVASPNRKFGRESNFVACTCEYSIRFFRIVGIPIHCDDVRYKDSAPRLLFGTKHDRDRNIFEYSQGVKHFVPHCESFIAMFQFRSSCGQINYVHPFSAMRVLETL